MKVHVDPGLCSGSGACVDTCPQLFELNQEGVSTAKTENVPEDLQQKCKEAAENCPTQAISIEE
ncbi:MAG TPA: ferredoxin [Sedimentisphaerales bacterium]|nr:ferredoxin [Sedimentisphaerales bacterium]